VCECVCFSSLRSSMQVVQLSLSHTAEASKQGNTHTHIHMYMHTTTRVQRNAERTHLLQSTPISQHCERMFDSTAEKLFAGCWIDDHGGMYRLASLPVFLSPSHLASVSLEFSSQTKWNVSEQTDYCGSSVSGSQKEKKNIKSVSPRDLQWKALHTKKT
jgi:hypothetical protein